MDPSLWVVRGLRDPDRVFPKNQANPRRKPRCRLISGASLVDQLVTRMFFQGFAEKENEYYPSLPTKKGIGFNAEHAQLIMEGYEYDSSLYRRGAVVSDVSGWEKSFSQDCALIFTEVARKLCDAGCDSDLLLSACEWWRHSLLSNIAVFGQGHLIKFRDTCVQRSGNYLTTSSNGIARVGLAVLVGSDACSMGDDCFEWSRLGPEELAQAYQALGLKVRDVAQLSQDELYFCSHHFYRDAAGLAKCYLFSYQRMLFESSFGGNLDECTEANYLKELEDSQDKEPGLYDRVVAYLEERRRVASGLPHDQEETGQDW